MLNVYIAQFVNLFITVLILLVFVRALLSWFPHRSHNFLIDFIYKATDPFFRLVRRYIPAAETYGFSPIVIALALELVQRVLLGLLNFR